MAAKLLGEDGASILGRFSTPFATKMSGSLTTLVVRPKGQKRK